MLKDILYKIREKVTEELVNYIYLPSEKTKKEITDFVKENGWEDFNLQNWDYHEILSNFLALWLWKYERESDVIKHHDIIYPPLEKFSPDKKKSILKVLENIIVRDGNSSVGIIGISGKSIILNNTFEDPRSAVSIEDTLIRDFSWVGIPVLDGNVVKFVVSFFLPYFYAWKEPKVIEITLHNIIKEFKDTLISYHYNDTLLKELENYPGLIGKISYKPESILNAICQSKLFSPKAVLLLKENKIISKEHIFINNDEFEKFLTKEIEWCSTIEHSNCNSCDYKVNDFITYFIKNYLDYNKNINIYEEYINDEKTLCLKIYYLSNDSSNNSNFENNNTLNQIFHGFKNLLTGNYDYYNYKIKSEFFKTIVGIISDYLFDLIDIYTLKTKFELIKIFADELKIVEDHNQLVDFNNLESFKYQINFKIFCILLQIKIPQKISKIKFKLNNDFNCIKNLEYDPINFEIIKHPGTLKVLKRAAHEFNEKGAYFAGKIITKYFPLCSAVTNTSINFNKSSESINIEFPERKFSTCLQVSPSEDDQTFYIRINNKVLIDFFYEYLCSKSLIFEKLNQSINGNNTKKYGNIYYSEFNQLDLPAISHNGKYIYFKDYEYSYLFYGLNLDEAFLSEIIQYLEEIHKIHDSRLKEFNFALKAAIAAIMARNMSHNIGSHVLAKMGYGSLGELNLPDSQVFYKYLQQRMDFIAIISTEFPQWGYSSWFIKEIMYWFYQQNCLLQNIAKLEGIKGAYIWSKNSVENDNLNTLLLRVKYNGKWVICNNNLNSFQNGFKDFLVSIPGGIIGYHAFYVILEDKIRNSAKHNWANLLQKDKDTKKQLVITIDIEDNEKLDYITFKLYDNISNVDNDKNNKLVETINSFLKKSFIDESGKLRKENWGIQEMKISAGFLQKSKIDDIGSEGERTLNIFKAIEVNDNGENRLAYEFKLYKPKRVAIIGKINDCIRGNIDNNNAKKYGIYYFENSNALPNYDFEFLILIDDEQNEILNRLKNTPNYNLELELEKLPYRLFIVSNQNNSSQTINRAVYLKKDEFKGIFNNSSTNFENLIHNLYNKWIKFLEGINQRNDPLTVNIDFHNGGSSEKWDLELFKKYEKILKRFAISHLINENKTEINLWKKVNQAWDQTVNDADVKNGLSNPLQKFFNECGFTGCSETLSQEFISSISALEKVENLPPIFTEHEKLTNNNNNENASIQIKRHNLVKNKFYSEEISGACTHYLILSDYKENSLIHYQVLENALLKILIIDERVNDFIKNKSERVKYRFSYSRIIIPFERTGVKIKINGKEYKYIWSENDGNLIDFSNQDYCDCNVLIIHQGIIDKMKYDEEKIDPKVFISEVRKKVPFVIITSGRGEPENVPLNAKFLPYSVIETTLLKDYHEKFILTQTIMSLKNRR